MDCDHRELLEKAVRGDDDALAELLKAHARNIRTSLSGHIPKKLRSILSEDDIVQQTYADAFTSISTFDPDEDGSFSGWLCRLAQCNLIDAIRALKTVKRGGSVTRVTFENDASKADHFVNMLLANSTSPSGRAVAKESRTLLKEAMRALPESYRAVIQMYDLDGEDTATVANALERSEGAVFMLRARAHDRLRILLNGSE